MSTRSALLSASLALLAAGCARNYVLLGAEGGEGAVGGTYSGGVGSVGGVGGVTCGAGAGGCEYDGCATGGGWSEPLGGTTAYVQCLVDSNDPCNVDCGAYCEASDPACTFGGAGGAGGTGGVAGAGSGFGGVGGVGGVGGAGFGGVGGVGGDCDLSDPACSDAGEGASTQPDASTP